MWRYRRFWQGRTIESRLPVSDGVAWPLDQGPIMSSENRNMGELTKLEHLQSVTGDLVQRLISANCSDSQHIQVLSSK